MSRQSFMLFLVVGLLFVFTCRDGVGQAPKGRALRIGVSPSVIFGDGKDKAETAQDTLRKFIKDETGLDNQIVQEPSWQTLAEQMTAKQLPVGVFQGYEFAQVRSAYPTVKALALAVNGDAYVIAYIVARTDNQAKDLAGLQGQTIARPPASKGFPWFFVESQCQALGKKPEEFFGKITTPDNYEDALDDVVDGVIQAAVLDRPGLEAYRRRKPGRFQQLKEVAKSPPAPPPVIAYAEGALDKGTLDRFRTGLIQANKQERGKALLSLFRLSGFVQPPADFDRVLENTRKAFPLTASPKTK